MTLDEVIKYFGSSYRFGKKTGMGSANYLNWERRGYIPIETQLKLEMFTKGKLKANLDHVPRYQD